MKGDRQLPNWSSRPEPSGEQQQRRGPSKAAMVGEKLGVYLFEAAVFVAMVAGIAYIMMIGVGIMSHEFWLVPPLSFKFCAAFVWTTSVLSIWYYTIVTRGED